MTDDTKTFPDIDEQEGFLFVREWPDERLEQELPYIAGLARAVCDEIAFRADHPDQRDGTGEITADDVALYEPSDALQPFVPEDANSRADILRRR